MKQITEFLSTNNVQYFATIGLDGKPKVRPFQFMLEKDGYLWYCTSNKKDVFKELVKNPFFEVSVMAKDFSWLRMSGKAVFEDNRKIKQMVLDRSKLVKRIYNTPDNPDFEVFKVENLKAVIGAIGKDHVVIR